MKQPTTETPSKGQHWDPDRYRNNAGFVATLGMPVVELLAPVPGERILDLGCGEGALTAKLVAMGCSVLGVDASPEQIAKARAEGIDAHVVDGHALSYQGEFDAVFSNAALHWMLNPDAVIAGVRRALKPGGRFIGEMGGAGNVQTIKKAVEAALRRRGLDPREADPWYFPSPDDYRERLEKAGFTVASIDLIPRPTPLPGDIDGWLATFAESYFNRIEPDQRETAIAEIREELRPHLVDASGTWIADYVRLRFAARLTESTS